MWLEHKVPGYYWTGYGRHIITSMCIYMCVCLCVYVENDLFLLANIKALEQKYRDDSNNYFMPSTWIFFMQFPSTSKYCILNFIKKYFFYCHILKSIDHIFMLTRMLAYIKLSQRYNYMEIFGSAYMFFFTFICN